MHFYFLALTACAFLVSISSAAPTQRSVSRRDNIMYPGTTFKARHTTRNDNEPGMEKTQCQTWVNKGPNDNVIGVDSRTYGSKSNGDITGMCGVVVELTNPNNGKKAYGVILDRIWQNDGYDTQFDVSPAISQELGYGGHDIKGLIDVKVLDDFPSSYRGSRDNANPWKVPKDYAYGYPVCPGPPSDWGRVEKKNGLDIVYNDKLKTHCVFKAGGRPLQRKSPL